MRQNIDEVGELPASFQLDAARKAEPIEQGTLDHLCGLYAVINVTRLIMPKIPKRDSKLFEAGVRYLDDRGWLSTVLTEGMPIRLFSALGRHLMKKHGLEIARIAPTKRYPPEEAIMRAIVSGRPVLASIDPPLDHYSVIYGYTPTRWLLFDSYGYKWLSRERCTWSRAKRARHRVVTWEIRARPTYRTP